MTAPVFFLRPLPDTGRLTLDGAEGRHAATVRRLRAGERVDVTDGEGGLAECVVASAGKDRLELDVVTRSQASVPEPRVVVVQALVKGERSELAVELLTEVGVDEIVPWQAQRCVAAWAAERSARRWQQAAASSAKQARRALWPVVSGPATMQDIQGRIRSSALALVLHEEVSERLTEVLDPPPGSGEVLVVVGPEGGLTDEELDSFSAAGAHRVRLGPSVLRASTAGCAAAAVVMAATGRWT
ncbi:MAG TPA: 16S rRNA (uracil(1498)-N(3))-methyltransferase [Frankiaceae bacterium]|nr:16S rRNA (uracil(1498)-N(3))-methyltransferase [Frankiaceae bacterium]